MNPEEKAEKWYEDNLPIFEAADVCLRDFVKAYLAGYAEAERERTNLRSILNDLDELKGGIQHEPRTRKSI